jgi:hypothetical protein
MKTTLFIITLIALISCGEDVVNSDNLAKNLNKTQSLKSDDYFSDSEKSDIADFCQVLNYKVIYLNSNYASISSKKVPLTLHQSTCESDAMTASNVEVEVRNFQGSLYYGNGALFQDILTVNSSEISQLCRSVTNTGQVLRYTQNGSTAKWFYIEDRKDTDCGPSNSTVGESLCLIVNSGEKEDSGDRYKITNVERYKASMETGNKRGVVIHRKRASTGPCSGSTHIIHEQYVDSI